MQSFFFKKSIATLLIAISAVFLPARVLKGFKNTTKKQIQRANMQFFYSDILTNEFI